MQPAYDFDKKTHLSDKGATTTLDIITFVRGICELLEKKKLTVIQNMKNQGLKILLGV